MATDRVNSWRQFFQEVQIELYKMVWPTWLEFVGSTVVVFLIILAFAIYLGVIDFGLNYAVNNMFSRLFEVG